MAEESCVELTATAYDDMRKAADTLVILLREQNRRAGWWTDLKTGESLATYDRQDGSHGRNVPELLMLVVSELAEAMEGYRKNLMDDHLPGRKMIEVEIADAIIRLFDMGGGLGLDISGAIMEKMRYNARRADHRPENRRRENGKKF